MSGSGLACAVLAASIVLPASAQADALGEVIQTYLTWRGPALATVTSLHERGTAEAFGLRGRYERWQVPAAGVRETVDLGSIKLDSAARDYEGWRVTPAGAVQPMSPAELTDLQREREVTFGQALRPGSKARVWLAPPEALAGGGTAAVVQVSYGDADRYDLLIDPASGALKQERIVRNGRTEVHSFDDWRMVKGVRVAFHEHITRSGGAPDSDRRFDEVALNATPPATLFDWPSAQINVSYAAGASSTGWLPFDLVAGTRIFLKAKVDGATASAMLDSAAGGLVVDKGYAGRIGATTAGSTSTEGAAARVASAIAKGLNLQIGALTQRGLPAAVIDLSSLAPKLGRPLDVILGKDLLDATVVDIDFTHHRIAFADPAKFKAPEGADKIAIRTVDGLPVIDVSVEGGAPVPAHFDLGNPTPLLLYPAYLRLRPELLQSKMKSDALVGGAGGAVVAQVATLKVARLGQKSFRHIPVVVMPPSGGATDQSRVLANVGLPMFSGGRLIIDMSHGQLLVIRDSGPDAAFARDHSGLAVELRDTRLRVTHVASHSPAAVAGWREGDEIADVDGASISKTYMTSSQAKWREADVGRIVRFTMVDGSRRALTLAEYY